MMLKIKLYNCLSGDEQFQQGEFATGLGYLKSNCTGADIEIVKDRSQLVDCDLIGLSAVAAGLKEAVDILAEHTPDTPVVIGGQGTMWEGLNDYPFRHIVHGEGERALQTIIDGKSRGIKNIRLANNENIDTLKFPDIGKLTTGDAPILTSRGCPYNCNFCSSQKYWGKTRWHSAEYVYEEAMMLSMKYPEARSLYVLDDLFIVNRTRFDKIHELWMRNGIGKRFTMHSFIRSDSFTVDIAKKLKEMGFVSVRFGLESASPRILKLLDKKTTVEQAQRCIDICVDAGLQVGFSTMTYVPTETVADRQMTAQFINRNRGKAKVAGNYVFKPFPGTKYFNGEDALETNWNTR